MMIIWFKVVSISIQLVVNQSEFVEEIIEQYSSSSVCLFCT